MPSFSTHHQWDLLWNRDWNTCEAEWYIKLEVLVTLYSIYQHSWNASQCSSCVNGLLRLVVRWASQRQFFTSVLPNASAEKLSERQTLSHTHTQTVPTPPRWQLGVYTLRLVDAERLLKRDAQSRERKLQRKQLQREGAAAAPWMFGPDCSSRQRGEKWWTTQPGCIQARSITSAMISLVSSWLRDGCIPYSWKQLQAWKQDEIRVEKKHVKTKKSWSSNFARQQYCTDLTCRLLWRTPEEDQEVVNNGSC